MAWAILCGMNAPVEVSELAIDVPRRKVLRAQGCTVTNLKIEPQNISFIRTDECLPWPIPPAARNALAVPGFSPLNDLSRYMLLIRGLALDATFDLKIDGLTTARFTGTQLSRGVNLTLEAGPITEQALLVHERIREKNKIFFERWRTVQLYELPAPEDAKLPDWLDKRENLTARRAEEIERLDRALTQSEAAINAIRAPRSHSFELVRRD